MTRHILTWAAIGIAAIWAAEIVVFLAVWGLWYTTDQHQRPPDED